MLLSLLSDTSINLSASNLDTLIEAHLTLLLQYQWQQETKDDGYHDNSPRRVAKREWHVGRGSKCPPECNYVSAYQRKVTRDAVYCDKHTSNIAEEYRYVQHEAEEENRHYYW